MSLIKNPIFWIIIITVLTFVTVMVVISFKKNKDQGGGSATPSICSGNTVSNVCVKNKIITEKCLPDRYICPDEKYPNCDPPYNCV